MPPRAVRTFPLALLEPACTTEREIGNCWQRFSYLLSSCPWLVLHDRNYRHPNDLLTTGTGKSSLSPGMRKRVESETGAQKNKTIKVTELVSSELGTQSLLHYTQFYIQQLILQ